MRNRMSRGTSQSQVLQAAWRADQGEQKSGSPEGKKGRNEQRMERQRSGLCGQAPAAGKKKKKGRERAARMHSVDSNVTVA